MNILQGGDYTREYDEVPSSLLINNASRTLEQFTPTPYSPKPYISSNSVWFLYMILQDLVIQVSYCLYVCVHKGYLYLVCA